METWAGLAIVHQELNYVTCPPDFGKSGSWEGRLSAVTDPLWWQGWQMSASVQYAWLKMQIDKMIRLC